LDEQVTGKMEFKIKMNELPTDVKLLEDKRVAFVIKEPKDESL
jgi:hypothetical protein